MKAGGALAAFRKGSGNLARRPPRSLGAKAPPAAGKAGLENYEAFYLLHHNLHVRVARPEAWQGPGVLGTGFKSAGAGGF